MISQVGEQRNLRPEPKWSGKKWHQQDWFHSFSCRTRRVSPTWKKQPFCLVLAQNLFKRRGPRARRRQEQRSPFVRRLASRLKIIRGFYSRTLMRSHWWGHTLTPFQFQSMSVNPINPTYRMFTCLFPPPGEWDIRGWSIHGGWRGPVTDGWSTDINRKLNIADPKKIC